MVMRYYGNKEGLFAAAAEFDLRLPELTGVPPAQLGEVLVRHFLDRWEGDETLAALLRAASTNPGAAERMRGIFADQLGAAVARFGTDPATTARRAGLVASQILGLAFTRYIVRPAADGGRGAGGAGRLARPDPPALPDRPGPGAGYPLIRRSTRRTARPRSPEGGPRPSLVERGSAGEAARLVALHDGGPDQVAPLGPRAVVVAHLRVAQQVAQHEPGVAGPLTDPAVRHHVVATGSSPSWSA